MHEQRGYTPPRAPHTIFAEKLVYQSGL